MFHLLLKGYAAGHLTVIFHNEFEAAFRETLGVEGICGTIHSRDRVYLHMTTDEFVLHQPFQITKLPHVGEVQKAEQFISTDIVRGRPGELFGNLQTFDPVRVQKFQHEADNLGSEDGFHANDALGRFAEGPDPLPRGIFPCSFPKEGFEIICPRREDAFVCPNFNEVAIVRDGLRFDRHVLLALRSRRRRRARGRIRMNQKQRIHVFFVIQQLFHILEKFRIVRGRLGRVRLPLLPHHDYVPPLQLDALGRILILQRINEVILQVILAQPVVFGVMTKERGETLRLEHEAGIIRVGRDTTNGVFGPGEVEVFLGLDGELDMLAHLVVVPPACSCATLSSCIIRRHG
mmetsp:Transcript_32260/g.58321  ORF Transcript_32260/g.58321 Transcript_32260/m.58321 type:complete len:347 (-) Transcript_32260:116-1156(-)